MIKTQRLLTYSGHHRYEVSENIVFFDPALEFDNIVTAFENHFKPQVNKG